MRTIGIFEAKTHLSEIVKCGEEICLTNRGKEIAVIIPYKKYIKSNTLDIFTELNKLKKRAPLGDYEEIIEMRNLGRK